jgi:DNA-binding SARP family transcriptional activator/TolB-like protein
MPTDHRQHSGTARRLVIDVVGRFVARIEDTEVRFGHRKTQALLACLALQDNNDMLRERLVGLIWSESEEHKARASLRQALHDLREAFAARGFDGLVTDRLRVALDPECVEVDVLNAIDCARRAEVHPCLMMASQPMEEVLSTLQSVDPAFQSWVLTRRRILEDQLVVVLEGELVHGLVAAGKREALARALANIDPTNEVAVRSLMTARLELGDAAGAMQAYKALWDRLDTEFETEPSRSTQELFARIKTVESGAGLTPETLRSLPDAGVMNEATHPPRSAPPGPGTRPVISLAGIDCVGIRPKHHYLVEGFRRDLLSCLVRFREWLVRDGVTPLPDESTVHEYVVDASAYESSTDIRLVLMLRERRSGIYLWTERMTLSVEAWSDMQQAIVRRLAAVLNLHFSSGRLEALAMSPSTDPLAYDVWLRAQVEMASWDAAGFETSNTLMRDLIDRYPRFAPAYSHLAQLLNSAHFMQIGLPRSHERAEEACRLAAEAVRLDPVDSRGHLALGWAHAMAGRHDRASGHHEIARELNDNDPWTLLSTGLGAATRDEHALAGELATRAFDLCPSPGPSHWYYLLMIAFLNGDYQQVLSVDQADLKAVPYAAIWRIAALGGLGRLAEARLETQEFLDSIRSHWKGSAPLSLKSVGNWLLQAFPFASEHGWMRLREGLNRAGADLEASGFDDFQSSSAA